VVPRPPAYDGVATRITTPEGIWLISRPDTYKINPNTGCVARKGKPGSDNTAKYDACTEYSEILLMSPDLKRILRAYPVPNLPVEWLVLTKDAVYCGRQGDGAIPDSMVCRIDRSTHTFTGRVFPFSEAEGGSSPHTFKGWPGSWNNNAPIDVTGFDQAQLAGGVLKISDVEGKLTIKLDPDTLKPIT
jgi:hypothetical protein